MADEKQGTTNVRTGEISKGEIGTAPEDELAASEAPKALETFPEAVTHAEMIARNKKLWEGPQ